MHNLFEELKRRNVVRVGIAYAVAGGLIIELIDTITSRLGMPDWVPTFVIIAVLIGLPIALAFSWAFEFTSQGLKKTADVDADASITHSTGRRLDFAIIGMLERGGIVRAGPVPNAAGRTLEPLILTNVVRGSTVSTDEWGGYKNLSRSYIHGRVNHSAKQWRKGAHYTNSLEGYWSQLKRSIRGTHVHVSKKHMWKYVSEFSYRYNMRNDPGAMFDRLIVSLSLPRLTDC